METQLISLSIYVWEQVTVTKLYLFNFASDSQAVVTKTEDVKIHFLFFFLCAATELQKNPAFVRV